MPVVFETPRFKISIHFRDHNPPHVHAVGAGREARFQITDLELMSNTGFSKKDIKRIREYLKSRQSRLMEVWNEYREG